LFGQDGRRAVFVARRDGKASVHLDGRVFGPFDDARRPVFQPGGPGAAFIARTGSAEFVVAGGVEGARYDEISALRLAPDGTPVYVARLNGTWRVVAGGREGPSAGTEEPPLFLKADGMGFVYVERRADGRARVRSCALTWADCSSGPEHDRISLGMADPLGRVFGYVVADGEVQALASVSLAAPSVVEEIGRRHPRVSIFGLSPGGRHAAYVAAKKGGWVLVRDGREEAFAGVDDPLDLVVSTTGHALTVGLLGERTVAYVDAARVAGDFSEIDFPVFGPDGSRWAFAAMRGPSAFLVVDGKEGPPFEKVIQPRFSPDGGRVVYRARREGRRFAVVADGQGSTERELPRFDALFEVAIAPDGSGLSYGAQADGALWWVTETL
jgi:hypothetical protein